MEPTKSGRTVVVCGITGNQGNAVARELLKAGYGVRGLTRRPEHEKAVELSGMGAQIARCDLNDTKDVMQVLKGAWGAFGVFISMESPAQEEQQAKRFAVMVKNAGLGHYVYSSVAAADRNTGIPFFDNKARVENTIRELGMASYTILRPAFFMENFQSPWMWPELEQGRLSIALKPSTRMQMVAVEDIGRAACMAFEKCEDLNHAAIELAGDELTMPEAAEVLSEALNRRVQYVQKPISEVRAMSPDMATMYEWFDRAGVDINIRETASRYGIQPLTLKQWSLRVKWPVAAR